MIRALDYTTSPPLFNAGDHLQELPSPVKVALGWGEKNLLEYQT